MLREKQQSNGSNLPQCTHHDCAVVHEMPSIPNEDCDEKKKGFCNDEDWWFYRLGMKYERGFWLILINKRERERGREIERFQSFN